MAHANSTEPDQTAPEEAVWSGSTLFAIPLSIVRNNCVKSKIYANMVWSRVFEILGRLLYHNLSYFSIKHMIRYTLEGPYWGAFNEYL